MTKKIIGLTTAAVMTTIGVVWAFPSTTGQSNDLLTALGPVLAGFGVALAYVTLRGKR